MALEIECDQVVKPFVGSSALAGNGLESPMQRKGVKPGNLTQLIDVSADTTKEQVKTPVKKSLNISLNESSLSRGGGIASKIGLAMSRIV
jgi:hypothetical protein